MNFKSRKEMRGGGGVRNDGPSSLVFIPKLYFVNPFTKNGKTCGKITTLHVHEILITDRHLFFVPIIYKISSL